MEAEARASSTAAKTSNTGGTTARAETTTGTQHELQNAQPIDEVRERRLFGKTLGWSQSSQGEDDERSQREH